MKPILAFALLLFVAALAPNISNAQDKGCNDPDARVVKLLSEHPEYDSLIEIPSCDRIRHIRSGLECFAVLLPGAEEEEAFAFLTRIQDLDIILKTGISGRDISCGYDRRDGGMMTIYATQYPGEFSDDQLFAGFVKAIKDSFPNANPRDGIEAGSILDEEENEEFQPMAVAFDVEKDGAKFESAIWYADVKGWGVKVRSTFSASDERKRSDSEFWSNFMWAMAARSVLVSQK